MEVLDRRKPPSPALAEAARELRAWDGQFRPEQSTPVLVAIAYNRFLQSLVRNVAGEKAPLYASQMGTALVEHVLAMRPSGWTSNYDDLLLKSLALSVHEAQQASTWGIAHPVGHHIPLLRRWFDVGPFPQSGTTTTIKQTTKRMGPSMRLIIDLGNFDRSLHNITTGQSGQPFSSHYKDQWLAYYEGRSFPLMFASPVILDTLHFQPVP